MLFRSLQSFLFFSSPKISVTHNLSLCSFTSLNFVKVLIHQIFHFHVFFLLHEADFGVNRLKFCLVLLNFLLEVLIFLQVIVFNFSVGLHRFFYILHLALLFLLLSGCHDDLVHRCLVQIFLSQFLKLISCPNRLQTLPDCCS